MNLTKRGDKKNYIMPPMVYSYIRFSTPEQIKGDSLRRQTEWSEKYAKERGFVLDDKLKLQDLGLSAYSGAHRDRGALGTFLHLVESGKVAKGSILIVESLDRLSREEVFVALEQFMGLIRNGLKIVTLSDNREYDKNNLDAINLVVSIMSMCRAHEESAVKSMRLGKAWENKRTLAVNGTQKLSKKCPAWLILNKEKTEFFPMPNRVKEIQRIFKMKLSGKGATAIVRELNQGSGWKPGDDKKKNENEGKKIESAWRESYIKKILKDRSVIGEFQPHRLGRGKKREPIGEPIPDYYPKVIDTDDFFRVQEQIKSNIHKGGKTGKVNNLFTHIAKCGYCGGPMAFIDKGPAPKGGQRLICDRARRGLDCCHTSVRYGEFEDYILKFCKGLRPQDIMSKNDETETAINLLKNECEGKIGELTFIESEIKNITDSISITNDQRVRKILDIKLTEKLDKQVALKQTINNLKIQIDKKSRCFEDTKLTITSMTELIDFLKTDKREKHIDLRLKLRGEIRKLVNMIEVYPEGIHGYSRQNSSKSKRCFKLFFTSGSNRQICPQKELPIERDYDSESGETRILYTLGNYGIFQKIVSKNGHIARKK